MEVKIDQQQPFDQAIYIESYAKCEREQAREKERMMLRCEVSQLLIENRIMNRKIAHCRVLLSSLIDTLMAIPWYKKNNITSQISAVVNLMKNELNDSIAEQTVNLEGEPNE